MESIKGETDLRFAVHGLDPNDEKHEPAPSLLNKNLVSRSYRMFSDNRPALVLLLTIAKPILLILFSMVTESNSIGTHYDVHATYALMHTCPRTCAHTHTHHIHNTHLPNIHHAQTAQNNC